VWGQGLLKNFGLSTPLESGKTLLRFRPKMPKFAAPTQTERLHFTVNLISVPKWRQCFYLTVFVYITTTSAFHSLCRGVFNSVEINLCLHWYSFITLRLKISRHYVNQTEVVICSHAFSRAWPQLHNICLEFLLVYSVVSMCCDWSVKCGIGFTTLNWNLFFLLG